MFCSTEQNITYEAEQPAEWALPPADHRLTLLPDLFFVSGPPSLPKRAADVPADGVSTQMGALCSVGIQARYLTLLRWCVSELSQWRRPEGPRTLGPAQHAA